MQYHVALLGLLLGYGSCMTFRPTLTPATSMPRYTKVCSSPMELGGMSGEFHSPRREDHGDYTTPPHYDVCANNPCQNGGTCYGGADYTQHCSCTPYYRGYFCEYRYNPDGSYDTTTFRPSRGSCTVNYDCGGHMHGECFDGQCWCYSNFTGSHCESRMDYSISTTTTTSSPPYGHCKTMLDCSLHGHCYDNKCDCFTNFYGSRCQHFRGDGESTTASPPTTAKKPTTDVVYDCTSRYGCSYNGVCVYGFCACYSNFTGANCESYIGGHTPDHDRSTVSPPRGYCYSYGDCSGHGYCQNNRCHCYSNYTGDRCQNPPARRDCNNFCANGGTCTVRNNGFRSCHCSRPHYGNRCQFGSTNYTATPIRPTASSECDCRNGGTCIENDYGTFCICYRGFEGINCENRVSTTGSGYYSPPPSGSGYHSPPSGSGYYEPPSGSGYYKPPSGSGYHSPSPSYDSSTGYHERSATPDLPSHVSTGYADHTAMPGTRSTEKIRHYYGNRRCQQRCLNGGSCFVDASGVFAYCLCARGYTGEFCADYDRTWSSSSSYNGGSGSSSSSYYHSSSSSSYYHSSSSSSYYQPSSSSGYYEPSVTPGSGDNGGSGSYYYYDYDSTGNSDNGSGTMNGQRCRNNSPCNYRGACYNSGTSVYCHCDYDYTGEFCEERISTGSTGYYNYDDIGSGTMDGQRCRDASPCNYRGACYNSGTSFYCECDYQYTGEFCEERVSTGSTGYYDGSGYMTGQRCNSDSPCNYRGACINSGTSFYCECDYQYTGKFCEERVSTGSTGYYDGDDYDNGCPGACHNGGSCSYDSTYPYCICPSEYSGRNCEIYIDSNYDYSGSGDEPTGYTRCGSDAICNYNGMCFTDGYSYHCECNMDYDGHYCERNIYDYYDYPDSDSCPPDYCYNSGSCFAQNGRCYCDCFNDFTGEHCELYIGHRESTVSPYDVCSSQPCQNNGYCNSYAGRAYCDCSYEFTGRWCEKSMYSTDHDMIRTTYAPYAECENGGTYLRRLARCECSHGYMGRHCEIYTGYPDNAMCTYNIKVPTNYMVYLEINPLDLEDEPNCQFDNITIYSKDTPYYRNLVGGPYCGKTPVQIDTGSNSVEVVFQSDSSEAWGGFVAKYKAIPQVIVDPKENGSIQCYSCIYGNSTTGKHGDPSCINPAKNNVTRVNCYGVCKDVHITSKDYQYISRSCATSCSSEVGAMSFQKTTTTTNGNDTTINNCCDSDLCNFNPLSNNTKKWNNTTNKGPNSVPFSEMKQCYKCTYSKSGNVETNRFCSDPVVHHEIPKVNCSGSCYTLRFEYDGSETVERGCKAPNSPCIDGVYIKYDSNNNVGDEACCSRNLCNGGMIHPRQSIGGAPSITFSLLLLVCSTILALFFKG